MGVSMVYIGKNIVNYSKNRQFLPVMCTLCERRACAVPIRPLLDVLVATMAPNVHTVGAPIRGVLIY